MIAQELFADFHHVPYLPKCTIKVDFQKAYDTVDWQFIEKTIMSGNAGWGVWCSRGDDDGGVAPKEAHALHHSIGLVKVFCWGEVVKPIYLMLYVASKAKVRKLGVRWIDAENKTVVQMKQA